MKNKIIKLVKEGFSVQTLSKMNESQVNALYKRVVSEQQFKEVSTKSYVMDLPGKDTATELPQGVKTLRINPVTKKVIASGKEKELGEAKKKKGKNPWAICTATMGKKFGTTERSDWTKSQSKKYEKCVLDVKESIKEGKDPYETILENTIMDILESSLNPKMTKRDFLNNVYSKSIVEAEEAPVKAPPKPKTPTKPGKPDTPFKPKHKPKPKAEKNETSVSEAEEAPVKSPPKPKTPTKPGKPDTPFKPKHKPKPKARIPKWMTWDELGINLK